jgi:hypothetical protein
MPRRGFSAIYKREAFCLELLAQKPECCIQEFIVTVNPSFNDK